MNQATGEDTFQKYDGEKFKGKFLESAYEAITLGLGANINNYLDNASEINNLREKIKQIWSEPEFTNFIGAGSNARIRIPKMIQFGTKHFKK